MSPFETYERIVEIGGSPAYARRAAEMRRAFAARTGDFGPEDPWFEARSRALWDDALTRQGFAREVSAELPPDAERWIAALARAHRGLFRAAADRIEAPATRPRTGSRGHAAGRVLEDVLGGAAFVVHAVDEGTAEALEAASGYFDARLVSDGAIVAMLPGAVYHPEDASPAIDGVVTAARARRMSADDALDALLRMEQKLRSLSRVKAAYAYRADALSKVE